MTVKLSRATFRTLFPQKYFFFGSVIVWKEHQIYGIFEQNAFKQKLNMLLSGISTIRGQPIRRLSTD